MKLKVLGASGSETPSHNLSAFLIDGKILLDAGSIGMSLTMGKQEKIRYILLTHAHFDHIKGLPPFLDNMNIRNSGHSVTLVSGREVLRELKTHIFNDRIWPDFTKIYNGKRPVLKLKEIKQSRPVAIDGYRVIAERMNHTTPAFGFIIENGEGKAIAYTGDTGPTERFWKRVAKYDVRCLIVEVSLPSEMTDLALAAGHLTPYLLGKEFDKFSRIPPLICVAHIKTQYRNRIVKEIGELGMMNISILREGQLLRL